jgi:hypothetical protein
MTYIIPPLIQIGDTRGVVIAEDTVVYTTTTFFDYYQTTPGNCICYAIDNADNNNYAYIAGTSLICRNQTVVAIVPPPTGVTPKWVTLWKAKPMIVGTDGVIYFSKIAFTGNSITASSWVKIISPVTDVVYITPPVSGYNSGFIIDKSLNLWYSDNMTTFNTANIHTTKLATDVIDVVTNPAQDFWYINRKNEVYFVSTQWYTRNSTSFSKSIKLPLPPDSKGAVAISVNSDNKLGMIGLDGQCYYSYVGASPSGNDDTRKASVYWLKVGLSDIMSAVNDPGQRILSTNIPYNKTVDYMSKNKYTLLTSNLSNPDIKKSDGVSIIHSMAARGETNFYPFKILSLFDLLMMGKAQWTLKVNGINMYLLTFTTTDNYLPLGDVFIADGVDLSTYYVVLVVNDPQYSIMIPDGSYTSIIGSQSISSSYVDKFGNYTRGGSYVSYGLNTAAVTPQRYLPSNTTNYIVGDVAVNAVTSPVINGTTSYYGNIKGKNTDPVTAVTKPVSAVFGDGSEAPSPPPTPVRTYASVNGNYIMNLDNIPQLKINPLVYKSSTFNTYIYVPQKIINAVYVDFIPKLATAANCANGIVLTKMDLPYSIKPLVNVNCSVFMNKYIEQNNYEHVKDAVVSEYCGLSTSNCDAQLWGYCAAGPNNTLRPGNTAKVGLTTSDKDLLKIYPNSANEICNCFMPQDYYLAKTYNSIIGQYGDEHGMSIFKQMQRSGAFNYPECANSTCASNQSVQTHSFKSSEGKQCPSVQICENNLKLDLKKANLKDSPVNISMSNDCQQTINNPPPASPSGSKPPAPKTASGSKPTASASPSGSKPTASATSKTDAGSKPAASTTGSSSDNKTLWIIISIVILIVLLSLGLLIYFLSGKSK